MPNHVSIETVLDKALQAAAMRHRIIANNIANVETPGFRAQTVRFEQMLASALDSGRAEDVERLAPEILINAGAPVGPDGNSVVMEREVSEMLKNSMMYGRIPHV